MNTADRSIALMDTALRRRFHFIECGPDPSKLDDVAGVHLNSFLARINERIAYLYDQDHTIGHAYFMVPELDYQGLVSIMKNKVIPLLQEYFYEDWEKIELILGGAGKPGDNNYFLTKVEREAYQIFGNHPVIDRLSTQVKYTIVQNPSLEAFSRVYLNTTGASV
ncbi:hypothetical protein [Brevibacillus sp. NRS-1366]|uniref:hypothetical protein n=1 Tax=Brevibacillus sp. NRS-1366 TaxID=3233899 RepID=UPI003D256CF5